MEGLWRSKTGKTNKSAKYKNNKKTIEMQKHRTHNIIFLKSASLKDSQVTLKVIIVNTVRF